MRIGLNSCEHTSLVLAFELDNGDILLFPGDAQVGNWLSWQDVSFDLDGTTVTGTGLLRRTVVYKVGHHGSHNATLREKGLEMMERLEYALVPVNETMAKKKNWNRMPLRSLLNALESRAGIAVLRADKDRAGASAPSIISTDFYHEIEV